MAGTRVLPKVAVSAVADPVTPANITEATMLVWARPPRIQPTNESAMPMIRSVIPVRFMISLARMKNGMARKG
jgi:hypothetical protein